MCIAIVKPLGKTISKEVLEICSKNNPDGCGFAYVKDGVVWINKYMDFDTFYKNYKEIEPTSTMLIHFRIATHGKVEVKNCHPFKLNNRMALIHNGVISGYGDKQTKTDTQDFIDKIIGNISWKMWKNPSFIELVNKAIGYSKLCILDVDGNHYIVGEEKGEWVDGIWFSNKSYEPKKDKVISYSNNDYYNKQGSLWDMYGNESYDSWYNRTHRDEKVIYRCERCGHKFYEDDDVASPQCEKCFDTNLKEIGWKLGKDEYLYEEYLEDKIAV